jgi:putative ABC transport system permease protein
MSSVLAHAWRSWKNAKGVAILALAALAVGIGCATTIFTIVDAVMLKPLPYSHPDRWVALKGATTLSSDLDRTYGLSISDFEDYQQRTNSFDVLGWYEIGGDFNMSAPGLVQHVEGASITPSLLDNVGINPVLGRLFQDSDGVHVAVISSSLWKQLGADPSIIGQSITLNGQLYTVTGVMPAGFQIPIVAMNGADSHNDVWVPVKTPADAEARRSNANYVGYAMLKTGVTIAQARADARRVAAGILKENPGHGSTYTAALFGLQDLVAGEIRPYLLLFIAAAILLLLVTCANVAGLLVARSVSRAHEIAVRMALGAGRSHLAFQFFFEGFLLSIAAAGLGLLASMGLTRIVLSLAAERIPRLAGISIGRTVVSFVAGLACLTAMLPALAPLWQAIRTQPNEILSNGIRASASVRSRRLSKSLVVAEIAFAFLLLAVSGLLISELENLRHTSPGFDASHLLSFRINADDEKYPSSKAFAAHQEQVLSSLEALPGVTGAALTNELPLDGCCIITTFQPEGQRPDFDLSHDVNMLIVSPSYFSTMRIPLQRGRVLNAGDTNDKLVSIVIDESGARRYWPDRDPVGAFAQLGDLESVRAQVVGVVGDVRNQGLGEATRPEIYFLDALEPISPIRFVVRSSLPAGTLLPAVRSAVQRVDPERTIYSVRTMDEIASSSVTPQRLSSVVMSFFALAAFLMASLGIYGVTSYSVRERTVEIGTRMAVGAQRRDLLNLVLGDGLRMALYGIFIGIPAAAAATWLVMHYLQLHHIGALPYAASAALVGVVAIGASLFPAWRATLLSPMVAIRNETESLWSAGRRALEHGLISHASSSGAAHLDVGILAGFIDASRRADSFSQALSLALSDLREQLGAQSAMLFENLTASDSHYRCRAVSPPVAVAGVIPPEGFLLGRLAFNTFPVAFSAGEMDTVLRWSREQRPQRVPEIQFLKEIGVRLAVPLRANNDVIALLLLGPPANGDAYSSADGELIRLCAQQLALMIENARLTERIVDQEKVRRDVALATEVQERLLPQGSIENSSASIAAFTLPARGVGGDCFDFLELGDGGIGIALADVAGKGIAAALIMAVIQASLRIIASESQIAPSMLTAKMNDFLFRSTGAASYATFFYVQLHAKNRHLRYVNAGHNPPFLLRVAPAPLPQGLASIEELAIGGTIIGMFPGADYEEGHLEVCPGDVIVAFTDGVTEALNPTQEEFGQERLKRILLRVAHLPVKEIISNISQELHAWIADAPQHDDITLIVAKMN